MKICDLTGKRFGRYVVQARGANDKNNQTKWLAMCDCGQARLVSAGNLKNGSSRSCGCWAREETARRTKTHGKTATSVYRRWTGMIGRCENKGNKDYPRYGARGITVCDEWRESFETFYRDMGDPPKGMQIDRIDNNKGYCKENCRWATVTRNSRNRRSAVWVEWNGKLMTLADAVEQTGLEYQAVHQRWKNYGWDLARALTEPIDTSRRTKSAKRYGLPE
jgi:hypothetical protein